MSGPYHQQQDNSRPLGARDTGAAANTTGGQPIRIAVLTSLYPNSRQPRHGIFVEQRLRALVATGRVEARVIAPIPWFWSTHPRYGRYAQMAAVPDREIRYGLSVHHPRYVVVPKFGMTLAPAAMASVLIRALRALRAGGFDFDLIDAHYLYPDGVAAARAARRLRRPLVITARGTDVNTIAGMAIPGRQIRRAAHRAERIVTVSKALGGRLCDRGVAATKIQTLRNGVDLETFAPAARQAIRKRLGLEDRPVWLCVGHLTHNKGVHIALDALAKTPGTILLVAGDGPERAALEAQARRLRLVERVRFLGLVAHTELVSYYNAADVLLLLSRSEGMPNVVLEALACGTAVLATRIGGVPEIMTEPVAGTLLGQRSAPALLAAWRSLPGQALEAETRQRRRRFAERFGWEATSRGQLRLFEAILAGSADARPAASDERGEKPGLGIPYVTEYGPRRGLAENYGPARPTPADETPRL